MNLQDQVAAPNLWPTPQAYSHGESNQPGITKLDCAVRPELRKHLIPTPDANCWKGGAENQRKGQLNGSLNPNWVEVLMGFPPGWTDLED